jgi:hypothetical protein
MDFSFQLKRFFWNSQHIIMIHERQKLGVAPRSRIVSGTGLARPAHTFVFRFFQPPSPVSSAVLKDERYSNAFSFLFLRRQDHAFLSIRILYRGSIARCSIKPNHHEWEPFTFWIVLGWAMIATSNSDIVCRPRRWCYTGNGFPLARADTSGRKEAIRGGVAFGMYFH